MKENFPLNRYDFSNLAEYIQKVEELPNVITDRETGIEFYGGDTISRDSLADFFQNFNLLDNLAQDNARREYEKHKQLGVESFQFEPSWAEIDRDKVIVGYVGIYINTDFRLVFSKTGGQWVLKI